MMKLEKEQKCLSQGPSEEEKEEKTMEMAKTLPKKEGSLAQVFQVFQIKRKTRTTLKQDGLLAEANSAFERDLIQQCREDGMSDGEIRQWLKQL